MSSALSIHSRTPESSLNQNASLHARIEFLKLEMTRAKGSEAAVGNEAESCQARTMPASACIDNLHIAWFWLMFGVEGCCAPFADV